MKMVTAFNGNMKVIKFSRTCVVRYLGYMDMHRVCEKGPASPNG